MSRRFNPGWLIPALVVGGLSVWVIGEHGLLWALPLSVLFGVLMARAFWTRHPPE